ncbi:ChrR family anti-sigma-E factor [Pseudoroseicyclus tamaricis]|uniref:Transcriptional regulator n=1 Tax=Pseudoroseicyclus tamaricis TaxID=2705421 RepID=A0A6B2JXV7_9RHOB|nr:ChrR family anti-sigma-E factor [Pseudoroseicyclus tamaricis]NDV01439.1 transcriptional regulator [Pseudoroseicyclus tamaricis]
MNAITHHLPDEILAAYAGGSLDYAFELVVAAHVSLCDECRAALTAHEAAGGAVLEEVGATAVSPELRSRLFAELAGPEPEAAVPTWRRRGPYPAPVVEALEGAEPRWRSLGNGARQCMLEESARGSVRLLYIPPGQAMPEHGHRGLELTLVLQGAYRDASGRFGPGDVAVEDDDEGHQPIAEPGEVCICLAAADAPLHFRGIVPRLAQRFFRI